MRNIQLIYETNTAVCAPSDRHVLHEEKTYLNDTPVNKVIFRTKLQTANEVNGNNRFYSKPFCNSLCESLKSKAKGRSLFQEVDHPMVADPRSQEAKSRAVVIEMKNVGSLIRDIYMQGNDIIGEVETLSGFMGPDLANVISIDNANIGFSARLFAQMKPRNASTGSNSVMEVTGPFKAVTYDVVTNPSHSSARIIDFISESNDTISVDREFYNCISENFIQESEDYKSNDSLLQYFEETLQTDFDIMSRDFNFIKI